jgi:Rrf2 family protein
MRINRELQYGLLFVIYLSRSGRSTIDTVSKNINVPKSFLEQIARNLRIAGLIKATRGPSGGYELIGTPTMLDVFSSLNQVALLSPQEMAGYKLGELEHRAMARMVEDMIFSLAPVMRRSVKDVVRELVEAELYVMNKTQSLRPN